MKAKKWLLILLALCLIAGLCACGDDKQEASGTGKNEAVIDELLYEKTSLAEREKRFYEAYLGYTELSGYYPDLGYAEKAAECLDSAEDAYQSALNIEKQKKKDAAVDKFALLSGYKDCDERYELSKAYVESKDHLDSKRYYDAYVGFKALAEKEFDGKTGYFDSASKADESLKGADKAYKAALSNIDKGDMTKALSNLEKLGEYEDTVRLTGLCQRYADAQSAAKEGKYSVAAGIFRALSEEPDGFSNSAAKAEENEQKAEEAYNSAADLVKEGNMQDAIAIYALMEDYSDCAVLKKQAEDYISALELEGSGKIAEAAELFTALGDYADAAGHIAPATDYMAAMQLAAEGKFDEAIAAFTALGEYSDSSRQIENINNYREALNLESEGKYNDAIKLLKNMSSFLDSKKRNETLVAYNNAKNSLGKDDLYKAYTNFAALSEEDPPYADSAEQAAACLEKMEALYQEALVMVSEKNFDDAEAAFTKLGEYSDSAKQLSNVTAYKDALTQVADGKYDDAITAFTTLGTYADSKDQITMIKAYQEAGTLLAAGSYQEALDSYTALTGFKDSEDQAAKIVKYLEGKDLLDAGDYNGALDVFSGLGADYTDCAACIDRCSKELNYIRAGELMAEGNYDEAFKLYVALRGFRDVNSILSNDRSLAREAVVYAYSTPGETVDLGVWKQGAEEEAASRITWYVIDRDEENHRVLLLSEMGLETMPYNDEYAETSWQGSTLHAWLNGEFASSAFTADELAAIIPADVNNDVSTPPPPPVVEKVQIGAKKADDAEAEDSAEETEEETDEPAEEKKTYSTFITAEVEQISKAVVEEKIAEDVGSLPAGTDMVFLLSAGEAETYLAGSDMAKCVPTARAIAQGAAVSNDYVSNGQKTASWWLRSFGWTIGREFNDLDMRLVAICTRSGSIEYNGSRVDLKGRVVRPAIWVDVEKVPALVDFDTYFDSLHN